MTKLGEQATGLVSPDSSARQWFKSATEEVESWRSDEAKLRALKSSDAMAAAKARGELGFTQFFDNAIDNPVETIGQFAESALPTIGAALVGTAAAPVTGGLSLGLPLAIGGLQGAGETRNQIYDHIMAMPEAQLAQNEQYQALTAQGFTSEQARAMLASSLKEHGGEVLATGVSSAVLSKLGGLGRIGQVGNGVMGSTAGKFASELVTEPMDEVFQQFMGNKAIRDIDKNHSLTDGLGEAAAGGLLFGAMGGGVAAADNIYRKPSESQVKQSQDDDIDNLTQSNNTDNNQAQPQAQPQTQPQNTATSVNEQALERVLADYQSQVEESTYEDVYDSLKADIRDGLIAERAKSNTQYGQFARDYLAQTGQGTQTTESTKGEDPSVENGNTQANAQVNAQAESAVENSTISEPTTETEQDLETKAEKALYSRSPIKSVEANIKRGQARMTQAILDKADVKRGMFNGEFGWVDFVWGDDGTTKPLGRNGEPVGRGIAHIFEARERKDGQSYQETSQMLVNDIVNTIAKGQVTSRTPSRIVLEYKDNPNALGHKAVLTKDKGYNGNAWVLTAFENDPTKGRKANSEGETKMGYDKLSPTQNTATLSRDGLGASEMHQPMNQSRGATTSDLRINSPIRSRTEMGAIGTNNVQQSTPQSNNQTEQNPETEQARQVLRNALGEHADRITFVRTADFDLNNKKERVKAGAEGFYQNGKLYINLDNIHENEVQTKEERLIWVAWHELAHNGVDVRYKNVLSATMQIAQQHVVVSGIARRVKAEYQAEGLEIDDNKATEEALVELYAAQQTGNWAEIESRYKVKIHHSWKSEQGGLGKHLSRIAGIFKRLISAVTGKNLEGISDQQLFDILAGIKQGINDVATVQQNSTAYSPTNEARYSFAGINAKNADLVSRGRAAARVADGENAETVRQETGWFKGADNQWRFEINENPELINPYQAYDDFRWETEYQQDEFVTTLGEVWKDKRLFEAYPHLAGRKLTIKPLTKSGGYFDPATGEIVLSSHLGESVMREALVHEVQHAIQYMEGFLNGSNPEAELARFSPDGLTGNKSVDQEIRKKQEELASTQDPTRIAELQEDIREYQRMVADNNYRRSAGEVEARNAQRRIKMTENERLQNSPESTEDVPRANQILRDDSGKSYSLNENADSEFARAVDAVASGNAVNQYIQVGSTPSVLKMLGLPDVRVTISGQVLHKVMQGKHNVTPETLKQLPKQINNPVAVMRSSTQDNSYVVLTELVENDNGKDKPVIAALHLKKSSQGLELISIASVYGRSNSQIQRGLDNDLLYWNKAKGSQFLTAFGLQLPSHMQSNANLSANNVKTEQDLRQYQAENSVDNARFSRRQDLSKTAYDQAKSDGRTKLTFEQWKQVRSPEFKAWFGDWENDPENASKVVDPKTGEPLVVYRADSAEINKFDKRKARQGFFFTSSKNVAQMYGSNVREFFLNLRMPKVNNRALPNQNNALDIKNSDFDGVLNAKAYGNSNEYIVVSSNQIKSATDNNGNFDPNNADIRFSRRARTNDEFANAVPKRTANSFDQVKNFAKSFLNKTLHNNETGIEAIISRANLDKMLSGKAHSKSTSLHDHLTAVANADQLFENAIHGWTESDKNGSEDIVGVHKMFAPLNINGTMKLVKLTVKELKPEQGNRVYSVETIEVGDGTTLSPEMAELGFEPTSHRLLEGGVESLIQRIKDFNSSVENNDDETHYSRRQTVEELVSSGKAKAEPTVFDDLKAKDYKGFVQRVNKATGKVDEWVADALRPVNDWIDGLLKRGLSEYETEQLKGDMYRAKGVRDFINTELTQAYLKSIIKKVGEIAKAHKMDELTAKRMVGYWISGRYSIEKNRSLLRDELVAMREAKEALDKAIAKNGDIETAEALYRKAERQYRYRKHDVGLPLNSTADFKVGTAGGWSIAEAENFMRNIEKRIPRKKLEEVAELVYDLNQHRLDIDHHVGRYTEEQYQTYKKNRHYVPLTGDPNAEEDFDGISGAGQNAVNVSKDKALKGRKLSEAEDGIDASWRAINKSSTYAGWADFKNRIDEIYETKVAELVKQGYSQRSAREEVAETLGITKSKMKGTTRSNDNVLIRKVGGVYYEYSLPTDVMTALKNDNVEHANSFLTLLSKPTSWYARGVTQWTITFAPMNMMRDTWEKSEFIRVQKLFDKNGKRLDDKTMDKIGRAVWKNAYLNKGVWKATKRMGFNQELRQTEENERLLKQLLELGGVSTYSTYFAKTETDLVKAVKTENSHLAKKLEQAGNLIEGYNKVFDTVSALSAYKAMIDNGVDPKQAAATTLELTNFRKTGSKMRGIKALYMFAQPTAMGARNLIKYLSTKKGQRRFVGYMVAMTSLYLALRAMDDEDEGGNVMDQLGDITRYIPLPLGDGKYFKFPVGFGMPQMAWNFSVNMVKAMVGDISFTEAGTNMAVHTTKTLAPVSPSEISAAKYPLQKLALTFTPTILQPLMQNVVNRSAFGNVITPNFVVDHKLKAEQSKSTTAQFWQDLALEIHDSFGFDMHPEQIKNLVEGYAPILGSLRELQTVFIENPNREQLGRRTRTPFLNQFIGTTNEFAIQSRYYEASEEAQAFAKSYKSRLERGVAEPLNSKEKMIVAWYDLNQRRMRELRAEKGKATKALNKGTITPSVYDARIKAYNKQMDGVQRVLLKRWREINGLNTN